LLWVLLIVVDGCDLYLAPSTLLGSGRGIICGKDFPIDYIVETVPSIIIEKKIVDQSQLANYVYGRHDDHEKMIMFGAGAIYNSLPSEALKNVHHIWTEPGQAIYPHSMISLVVYQILINEGKRGYELFTAYGKNWFAARGIYEDLSSYIHPQIKLSDSDLKRFGVCITDVYIADSKQPFGGVGLFARRSFKKGEVVTVTPVLSMSRSLVDSGHIETNDLINYCIASKSSEMVLFPLNYPAVINHGFENTSNVRLDWFNWAGIPGINESYAYYLRNIVNNDHSLQKTIHELIYSPFAQLDLAYIATRDIAENEEILLHYGRRWELAWEEYQKLCGYSRMKKEIWKREMPDCSYVFREYIEAPDGMYPDHWYNL
jgi:hypothetical protein